MVEAETNKLKSLGKVFDTLLEMQKLRVNTKKNEIEILKNKLKHERVELQMLAEAYETYKSQLVGYNQNLKNFEKNSKKELEAMKAEIQNISYVG